MGYLHLTKSEFESSIVRSSDPSVLTAPSAVCLDAIDRVRSMATEVTLYIGPATVYKKFRFTDPNAWEAVRSQILSAMNAGKGTIEIPWKGDTIVYVYSPYLG